ncbi:signal peptidase I, partial [Clostridium perfringens]
MNINIIGELYFIFSKGEFMNSKK